RTPTPHHASPLFPYTTLFRSTARVVKTLLRPHLLELLATRFSLYIHLLGSQRPSHHGCVKCNSPCDGRIDRRWPIWPVPGERSIDRKSTRLNSSHVSISYAVF